MKLRISSALGLPVLLLPALADIGPALTGLTAGGRDATSVFWTPTAITRLEHSELVIQSGLVYQDAKFKVDAATFDGGSADNDNGFLLVPGLHYVHRLSDNFRLGLSLNVPSGIGNDYGKTWSGRYLSTESTLSFLAAAAPPRRGATVDLHDPPTSAQQPGSGEYLPLPFTSREYPDEASEPKRSTDAATLLPAAPAFCSSVPKAY